MLLNPYRFGPAATDPDFSSVALLLHLNGADGSTTFTDSSSSAKTLTRSGSAEIDTAQSRFGGASCIYGGNTYLASAAAMSFGTGDFTVEGWFRFNTTGDDRALLAGIGSGTYDFTFVGNTFYVGRVNTAFDSSFAFTRSTGVWYHMAVTRSGTSLRFFVDGTQIGSTATNSTAYNAGAGFYVGASTAIDRRFDGWIDDFRVTVGLARYTSNFTAPSSQFPDS